MEDVGTFWPKNTLIPNEPPHYSTINLEKISQLVEEQHKHFQQVLKERNELEQERDRLLEIVKQAKEFKEGDEQLDSYSFDHQKDMVQYEKQELFDLLNKWEAGNTTVQLIPEGKAILDESMEEFERGRQKARDEINNEEQNS